MIEKHADLPVHLTLKQMFDPAVIGKIEGGKLYWELVKSLLDLFKSQLY